MGERDCFHIQETPLHARGVIFYVWRPRQDSNLRPTA